MQNLDETEDGEISDDVESDAVRYGYCQDLGFPCNHHLFGSLC